VLDGVDAFMLSSEASFEKYPVEKSLVYSRLLFIQKIKEAYKSF